MGTQLVTVCSFPVTSKTGMPFTGHEAGAKAQSQGRGYPDNKDLKPRLKVGSWLGPDFYNTVF